MSSEEPILPRDLVASRFAVSVRTLSLYERHGLIAPVRVGGTEGYPPSALRRLWTVVSLHRDLGINLAGIEAVLKLRDHLDLIHHQLEEVSRELLAATERGIADSAQHTGSEG
jgi:MerR family transcriptional regulator/heat shock protein HspR